MESRIEAQTSTQTGQFTRQQSPDLASVKTRQQQTWSSGDYAVIGVTLQLVGESLCEAMDLRPGSRVLDVAAGNGNATLAAARRDCDVVSTDYVPALLERGRTRASAEGLGVRFETADAENLPFTDHEFDAVLSTYGVMFSANQTKAAAELARVCKAGGRIGLANWTPDGFVGLLLKLVGRYVPPPAGVQSPLRWGTLDGLRELFPGQKVDAARRQHVFRYRTPARWLDTFRRFYGPTHKAFAALDSDAQQALASDLLDLIAKFNRGGDTMIVPSDYLEVIVRID